MPYKSPRRKSPMRKQRSRRKSPRRKIRSKRSKKKSKSRRKSPKRKSKSRRKKSRMPTASEIPPVCILCNAVNPQNCPLGCTDNTHQICNACLALNINCPGCYDEAIAPPATNSGGVRVLESLSGGPDQDTLASNEIIDISNDDPPAIPPTSSSTGEAISIGSGVGDINVQLYQTPGATMIDENGGGDPAQSAFISSEPAVSFGPIFSGTF